MLLLVVLAAALTVPSEGKQGILMEGLETVSSLAGLDTVAYLAKTVTSFMYIAQVVQEEANGPRIPFLGDANERELLERMKLVNGTDFIIGNIRYTSEDINFSAH